MNVGPLLAVVQGDRYLGEILLQGDTAAGL